MNRIFERPHCSKCGGPALVSNRAILPSLDGGSVFVYLCTQHYRLYLSQFAMAVCVGARIAQAERGRGLYKIHLRMISGE